MKSGEGLASKKMARSGEDPTPDNFSGIQNNFELSKDRLSGFLRSHAIKTDYLWQDDFEGFFADRETWLRPLIKQAMGKTINRRPIPELETEEEYEGLQTNENGLL